MNRRLVFSSVAVFLVVIGIFSWQTYEINGKLADEAKKQRIALLSEIVGNGLRSIMIEGKTKDDFQRFIEGLAAKDIVAVRILSESGKILSSTVPGEIGQGIASLGLQDYRHESSETFFSHEHEGHKVYANFIVLSNDWPCQRCHGMGDQVRAIVHLEVSHKKIDTSARDAAVRTVLSGLLVIVILALSVYILGTYQIRKPLYRLLSEIRAIAGGKLTARASVYTTEELGAIASAVNRIAEELQNARESVMRHETREMSQVERMASIGEVAATVAHEIKNPLAGISGALQVIAEDIPDDSPRKEIVNDILAEIDRLDRAVKDLVTYAKPHEINPVLTDLHAIIEMAVTLVAEAARRMHIEVNVLATGLPEVMVDPEQMVEVFKDVLLFQCSLMPDGGTISISSVLEEGRGEIEIVSSDTGKALSDVRIRNIFKPSFSTRYTATGLSFAIIRNILESHGGRIRVASEFGIGNTFRIIIPLKR
jgi:hypothetical protein